MRNNSNWTGGWYLHWLNAWPQFILIVFYIKKNLSKQPPVQQKSIEKVPFHRVSPNPGSSWCWDFGRHFSVARWEICYKDPTHRGSRGVERLLRKWYPIYGINFKLWYAMLLCIAGKTLNWFKMLTSCVFLFLGDLWGFETMMSWWCWLCKLSVWSVVLYAWFEKPSHSSYTFLMIHWDVDVHPGPQSPQQTSHAAEGFSIVVFSWKRVIFWGQIHRGTLCLVIDIAVFTFILRTVAILVGCWMIAVAGQRFSEGLVESDHQLVPARLRRPLNIFEDALDIWDCSLLGIFATLSPKKYFKTPMM